MEKNNVKVEFSHENKISTNFFKSSFARSIVTNCEKFEFFNSNHLDLNNKDDKQIDLEKSILMDNENNYSSSTKINDPIKTNENNADLMNARQSLNDAEREELKNLRKQCQALTQENRRLNRALRTSQASNIQVMDISFLQTQIDTLQWQLKQTEANRQMHQSLMKQIVHFLGRVQRSLKAFQTDNVNKNIIRNGNFFKEVPPKDRRATSPTFSPKLIAAKSISQITTPKGTGISHFTWSMVKKKNFDDCSLSDTSCEEFSKKSNSNTKYESFNHKSVIKNFTESEILSDYIPPEKLLQETFRLLRTIESLLAMRDPCLTLSSSPLSSSISSVSSSSSSVSSSTSKAVATVPSLPLPLSTVRAIVVSEPLSSSIITSSSTAANIDDYHRLNFPLERNMSLYEGELVNSTRLSDNFHDGNPPNVNRNLASLITSNMNLNQTINLEQENVGKSPARVTDTLMQTYSSNSTSISEEVVKLKKIVEDNGYIIEKSVKNRNNVEDESGFSSLNSFQDVGIPILNSTGFGKTGCHSEVGLPGITLNRINHRRWSSTPAEIQSMLKKYNNGIRTHRPGEESISVWV